MKVKKRYKQIAEMWNAGMSRKQIDENLQISEHTVQHYLKEARDNNLTIRLKKQEEFGPRKYEIVAELWNKGLRKEEIASELGITTPTVIYNLREARLRGITLIDFDESKVKKRHGQNNVKDREKTEDTSKRKYSVKTQKREALRKYRVSSDEDTKSFINKRVSQIIESELDLDNKIKELLRLNHPLEVAQTLGINVDYVFAIIENLSEEDKKDSVKQFISNRKNIKKNMDELIKLGKKSGEALSIIARLLPVELVPEMADVYFAIGEERKAIRLLKRLWMFDDVPTEIRAEVESKLKVLEAEVTAKSKRAINPNEQRVTVENRTNATTNKIEER